MPEVILTYHASLVGTYKRGASRAFDATQTIIVGLPILVTATDQHETVVNRTDVSMPASNVQHRSRPPLYGTDKANFSHCTAADPAKSITKSPWPVSHSRA
ncbi:MAG: hypothetical protein ACTS5I_06000, partial [Rhodanobacter sp.]